MVGTWLQAMDDGKIVTALLLDLSAGIDVIHHELLLQKFERYIFSRKTLDWFRSYLIDLSQAV